MKFSALRRYIKGKNLSSPHTLGSCNLVVDGDSFFKDTYKSSGCQYILGPDCDRYADFIIKKLKAFIDNDVKCYFIFSGVTKHNINKIKEIHQSLIGDRNNVVQIDAVKYFEPLLVNDVQKQVLKEMKIPYFVCEHNSIEAIVGLARKFKLPVLTNNVEYSCFGVSCITPKSVEQDNVITKLNCVIYDHDKVKTAIGVYNKMPILLALLIDSGDYLEKLSEIIEDADSDVLRPVIQWVKRQKEATVVSKVSRCFDDDENKTFKDVYEKIQTVYFYPNSNLVVKHIERGAHGLFKDDKKWLAKGVACGRVALPYINLKNKGVICGSLLMNDNTQPDALLAAVDIIAYSQCLLKNSQDSTITFFGRTPKTGNKISVNEIKTHWDQKITNRDIFTKHRVGKKLKLSKKQPEAFENFINEVLPGFDFGILNDVPLKCRILIVTLVYYVFKKNNDFVKGAYCVLLSYVTLSSAESKSSFFKSIFDLSYGFTREDDETFYNGLQFLFDTVNLKQKYNIKVVHNFSEFQHCLQHMNYLNKLCGENIPCTVYKDTYNATFIYNTFLFMDNKNQLMQFLENKFMESSRLTTFKNIVMAFENCLSVLKEFEKNPEIIKKKSAVSFYKCYTTLS